MKEEYIKLSFLKVKEDMDSLRNEIFQLKNGINELKNIFNSLPTIQCLDPTINDNPTHNPTVPQEIGGFKSPNLDISTGNRGVPTDRQTDRQTDNLTQKTGFSSIESNIREASDILDSLDKIKKEIRLKFKRITPQEMTVFSTIYQLEEQDSENTTYKQIAIILKLSESSIRDYVQRIISKGIPIKKTKINNRKILLSVSKELKKIVSLSTIIQLREL